MGTQLVLGFAKRLFFNLCNAQNSGPNSQTIRILSPYRNISLFSLVFILNFAQVHVLGLSAFPYVFETTSGVLESQNVPEFKASRISFLYMIVFDDSLVYPLS